MLADNNLLHTKTGHAAVGWLIVQDLIAVLALVLLLAIATPQQGVAISSLTQVLFVGGGAMLKVCGAVVLVIWVGGKLIPFALKRIAETWSRELFTLAVLVIVLLIAVGAARLFGISTALGAFLAGVVIGRSDFSLRAASDALPLQNAFAVLVFVSIGMLFDPRVLWVAPQMILATLGIVLVVTPLVTILSILVLGYPLGFWSTAFVGIFRIDTRRQHLDIFVINRPSVRSGQSSPEHQ
jgi:CPA2 family monovalent cation:H+ antiporter-2